MLKKYTGRPGLLPIVNRLEKHVCAKIGLLTEKAR